jgi:long-chain fatty acid transport protein
MSAATYRLPATKQASIFIFVLVIFFATFDACASGLWLYEGAMPDMGMANAGRAASGLDASTAGGNPAAMTVLDRSQLETGFMGLSLTSKFRVESSTYGGGGGGNAGYFTPSATFAYVHYANDRLRLGIMAGSYFGLGLKYGSGWSGRYYVQEGDMVTAGVNPVIGYKLNDYFSIGGGVSAVGAKLYNKTAINTLLPRRDDGELKYEDTDLGYGYNLGILFELSRRTRFGLTYRSPVDLKFRDKPNVRGQGRVLDSLLNLKNRSKRTVGIDLTLPQAVMFSAWHRLTPRLALCGNLGWQDWDKFGRPDISITGSTRRAFTADLKYRDTYHIALGGQYRFAPKWLASLGVAFDTSPIKHDYNRSPSLPLDRAIRYGAGLQYDINSDITIGGAYEFIDLGKARVDKQGGPLRGDVRGKYAKNYLHIFNFNMAWKF